MTDGRDFTVAELETIVAKAIAARDFEAVVAAIRVMATKDPDRAQLVLDTIELGLAIRGEELAR